MGWPSCPQTIWWNNIALCGSTLGSFTLAGGNSVELEKEPLNGVFAANAGVKASAIGYSN